MSQRGKTRNEGFEIRREKNESQRTNTRTQKHTQTFLTRGKRERGETGGQVDLFLFFVLSFFQPVLVARFFRKRRREGREEKREM
mmetsp:Transcript_31695/g.62729  ORF Transcript_31695/g.62729 Transcript_31695/m.62729 type:complete len:85 (-) Transcript_31695:479-733(-)